MNKILISRADKNDLASITNLFRKTIKAINSKDYTEKQIDRTIFENNVMVKKFR